MRAEGMTMEGIKKLWNKNFSILLQGQFISDFGNAIFAVALGFWVLGMTKSPAMPEGNKALMGLVLACFALPRVLIGPFAGALADRVSRKWLIVLADFTRGVLYTLLGLTVFFRVFPFNAIFPVSLLIGACDGFFSPALSSAIPDIVPMDDLSKANSLRSISTTATQLVGNSLGGWLFAVFGAPVMILVNGVSFLYASVTQLFMKIPSARAAQKKHIFHEMLDGVRYAFGNKGLRLLIVCCMFINFFSIMGITLLTPLFDSTPGFGKERYGLMMGAFMAGAVLGMVVFSVIKVKPRRRAAIFGFSTLLMALCTVPIGFIYNVNWLFPLAAVTGVFNAVINMMIQTVLQVTVPAENRGKVFGIVGTISGALMPLAMAISGGVSQLAGTRPTIVGSFAAFVLVSLPLLVDRHFKEFINTDIMSSGKEESGKEDGDESLLPGALTEQE